jgi:hypothetical protein
VKESVDMLSIESLSQSYKYYLTNVLGYVKAGKVEGVELCDVSKSLREVLANYRVNMDVSNSYINLLAYGCTGLNVKEWGIGNTLVFLLTHINNDIGIPINVEQSNYLSISNLLMLPWIKNDVLSLMPYIPLRSLFILTGVSGSALLYFKYGTRLQLGGVILGLITSSDSFETGSNLARSDYKDKLTFKDVVTHILDYLKSLL